MKKERVFLTGVYFLALSLLLGLSNGLNAQPLPDLVVTKIECVPPQSKFAFEVMNKSNVPLPKGWKAVADVYFDGVKKGFVDLGSPTKGDITPAGGVARYVAVFDILKPINVWVVADATNSIKESNEKNNGLKAKIDPCWKGLPDLIVEKVELPGEIILKPGEKEATVNVSVTVKNIGIAPAGSFTVMVGFMGHTGKFFGGSAPVSALNPGATITVNISRSLPPDRYDVDIIVDYKNEVQESNEKNNYTGTLLSIKKFVIKK